MPINRKLSTLIPATLLTVLAACVPATTGSMPGTAQKPQNPVRAQQVARVDKVWATPAKVHRDVFIESSFLKLKVTNFDASIGSKVKASASLTRSAEADEAADETGGGSGEAHGEDDEILESTATCQAAYGDGPAHEIAVVSNGYPAMSDHDDVMTITDKTASNSRSYAADQEFQRFTIKGDGETLTIVINPDDSLTVNGQPARTFGDAARLIAATKLARTTTIESLAVLGGLVAGWEEIADETLTPCAPPATTTWGGTGERVSIQAVGPNGDTSITGLVRMVILLLTRPS